MELRHPKRPERTAEENFAMVAEAGFDGICLDPAVHEIEDCLKLRPHFESTGLKCMINAFPYAADELAPILVMAKELNACLVNVIGGIMPLTVEDGVPVIRKSIAEADAAGIPVLFETHRDSILNDLYYTLQMIDAVPEMRLCADLSHFVIDREMPLPLSDANRAYMHRILERSDCFQGRISNREQIQVPIGFPQHREWVDQFKAWWKDGMCMWRDRSAADATVVFLCELGPPSYAITDAQGNELSDRWEEALIIKSWVEEIWAELSA